jgi:hypothetical protein
MMFQSGSLSISSYFVKSCATKADREILKKHKVLAPIVPALFISLESNPLQCSFALQNQ